MPLRIFFDTSLPIAQKRSYLAEIARPFWSKKPQAEREEIYGTYLEWFSIAESMDDADIAALPMTWNYYRDTRQQDVGLRFAQQAKASHKPLVVFSSGDFKPNVPIENAIVFSGSFYRSRARNTCYAHPAIFEDYIQVHFNGELPLRRKQAQPVIGFCGQADATPSAMLGWWVRNLQLNVRDKLGSLPFDAPPIQPHLYLRKKTLELLRKSDAVKTDFIIHKQYWAGLGSTTERQNPNNDAKKTFVNNIVNTDYTVCVRGLGNYSKRLYETLCCGRIPIFVNTDCILPFEFAVDWRQYCVWVEQHELDHIAEKVLDFHQGLSDNDFIELQRACRQFWQEWLTLQGFYAHFHLHFAVVRRQHATHTPTNP